MRNNRVFVRGNLGPELYFEFLPAGVSGRQVPYLRFGLVVPRDVNEIQLYRQRQPRYKVEESERQAALGRDEKKEKKHDERADLIRVVQYGPKAWITFFYLKTGAAVQVNGWLESRPYWDRGENRRHRVMEVHADEIILGEGCDFARGDAHQADIVDKLLAAKDPDVAFYKKWRVMRLPGDVVELEPPAADGPAWSETQVMPTPAPEAQTAARPPAALEGGAA